MQVRSNLHVVLCFSPVGDAFRERLRKFPSLTTCTTIDWFTAWPDDALRSVADRGLRDLDVPERLKPKLAEQCMLFHRWGGGRVGTSSGPAMCVIPRTVMRMATSSLLCQCCQVTAKWGHCTALQGYCVRLVLWIIADAVYVVLSACLPDNSEWLPANIFTSLLFFTSVTPCLHPGLRIAPGA
jgi:hypothetical protein